jgi:hypothetical protein
MLFFCDLTPSCVVTLPGMSLPPLFAVVSQDLGLSMKEVSTIWGAGSFAGIFFALISDTLEGRFGTCATFFATCFMTDVFGLARSFAVDYTTLLFSSLSLGISQAIIPIMLKVAL